MECCSPDVGDCRICHPELWKKSGAHWISKQFPVETRHKRPKTMKKRINGGKGTRKMRGSVFV